ncbi:MAG: hypothetical protein AMXMBFR7_33790 [Planctomycetota bacterium]
MLLFQFPHAHGLDAEADPFKPQPEDVQIEVLAPDRTYTCGEVPTITLRITARARRAFRFDAGAAYAGLSVGYSYPGYTNTGTRADGEAYLKRSPYAEADAKRLVALEPGATLDLPLELKSISQAAYGEINVLFGLFVKPQEYWKGYSVWAGRVQIPALKVRYAAPTLAALLQKPEQPDAGAAKAALAELLAPNAYPEAWVKRVLNEAANLALPGLLEELAKGRTECLAHIETAMNSKALTEDTRAAFRLRLREALGALVRREGPLPDGVPAALLRLSGEAQPAADLLGLLARCGPADRLAVLQALLSAHPNDPGTQEALSGACREESTRQALRAALSARGTPAELLERIAAEGNDAELLLARTRRGEPLGDAGWNALERQPPNTQTNLLRALYGPREKRFGPHPDERLRARDWVERVHEPEVLREAVTLAALPPHPIRIEQLQGAAADPLALERAQLLDALARGETPAYPDLRAWLEKRPRATPACPPPEQALDALEAGAGPFGPELLSLAYLTAESHLPRVRALLKHRDPNVVLAALEACGRLRDQVIEDEAIRLLHGQGTPVPKAAVARTLAELGTPRAAEELTALVRNPQTPKEEKRSLSAFAEYAGRAQTPGSASPAKDALRGLELRLHANGHLRVRAGPAGWCELVPACDGEPLILRMLTSASGAAQRTAWAVPSQMLHARGALSRLPFDQVIESSPDWTEYLAPGTHRLEASAVALTCGRWEVPTFRWSQEAASQSVFLPGWGVHRLSAGPQALTTAYRNPPLGGERLRPVGAQATEAPKPRTAGGYRMAELFLSSIEEIEAAYGRDAQGRLIRYRMGEHLDGPHFGSQTAVGPLWAFARRGDPAAVALALRAREAGDPYTAWQGQAALRRYALAKYVEGADAEAARWLERLMQRPEDLFLGYARLLPDLIEIAGRAKAQTIFQAAAARAEDDWVRGEAAALAEALSVPEQAP